MGLYSWRLAISLAGLLFSLGAYADPESVGGPSESERELGDRGKRLFESVCSVCHGLDGEGQGELGFKLTSPMTASWSDEQIAEKIFEGNISKGMPPFGAPYLDRGRLRDFGSVYVEIDIDALVAHIRTLQKKAMEQTQDAELKPKAPGNAGSGDPRKGEALFRGKVGCAACHTVGGDGSGLGPDLSRVGARYDRDGLFEAIVKPSRKVVGDFRMKELAFPRGRKVRGLFRNETSESIEVFNVENRAWTVFDKSEVLFYRTVKDSPMPGGLLDELGDDEVVDLLAFLMDMK